MTIHQFRTYRVIELVMNKEPFTSEDVASELGITPKVAQLHLKNLWVLNLMYICGWERQTKNIVPIYRWGHYVDVKKPDPKPRSVADKKYKQKKKELRNANNISAA